MQVTISLEAKLLIRELVENRIRFKRASLLKAFLFLFVLMLFFPNLVLFMLLPLGVAYLTFIFISAHSIDANINRVFKQLSPSPATLRSVAALVQKSNLEENFRVFPPQRIHALLTGVESLKEAPQATCFELGHHYPSCPHHSL